MSLLLHIHPTDNVAVARAPIPAVVAAASGFREITLRKNDVTLRPAAFAQT